MTDLFDLPFEDEAPEPDPESVTRPAVPKRATREGGSARRVFTVTELTIQVRDLLEQEFSEVWVEGELSNCRVWNTGHLYFTLKDTGAQLRGVIFRSVLRYLKFRPEDGLRWLLSPRAFNELTGRCVACPITRRDRDWSFHVVIAGSDDVQGVVQTDQLRSLSW